jgi:hypothetical protein
MLTTKRVYYTGTNTLYEGEPLCYNSDSTTNVEGTTVAEGNQNCGKYLQVEAVATANIMWFAGVVTKYSSGKTGPAWIDIYIPNGAIMPVRSYISSTTGLNALAIMNGQRYLGNLNAGNSNGAGRFVAIAEETVDRSSAAGLCLAQLCPDQFLWQSNGATKLKFATAGTVEVAANLINVQSSETTGTFTALFVRSEVATADSGDVALAIYGEANVTAVAAGSYCIGNRFSLNLWGGTQTAVHIHALGAEIYEEGANLTGSTVVSPLFLRTQIDATNPPAANTHWMITCRCDGADKPDGLLYAVSADAVKYETTSNVTGMAHIPIYINGVGLRYILLEDTA